MNIPNPFSTSSSRIVGVSKDAMLALARKFGGKVQSLEAEISQLKIRLEALEPKKSWSSPSQKLSDLSVLAFRKSMWPESETSSFEDDCGEEGRKTLTALRMLADRVQKTGARSTGEET